MLIPTTTRWSWPARSLAADAESDFASDVFEDFDRLVESFVRPTYVNTVNFQPSADVHETEGHYMINFDIPGVKKEDIKIEMRGNQLEISGERKDELKNGKGRSYGKFERSFTLPETVNAEKIEAHYEDGVLSLALPKAETAKPKTIEIQTGNGGFFSKLLSSKKENTKELKDVKVS
jgi:HSP20 family protein